MTTKRAKARRQQIPCEMTTKKHVLDGRGFKSETAKAHGEEAFAGLVASRLKF
jgi:hypothetical protein